MIRTLAVPTSVFLCLAGCGDRIAARGTPGQPAGSSALVEVRAGSRIAPLWITPEDGTRSFAGDWLDTALDLPCTFRDTGDGELRCLSYDGVATLYADDHCTTPI